MKKKLWATLVAFIALMVFATSAFAAARWRNVASISPSISAGDNNYTCEISCLSGTTKIDCTLVLYEKGYSEHILKFLVLPPPIMDTHMSFLVQLISNPVPLTS